jgi:hypothetical protein
MTDRTEITGVIAGVALIVVVLELVRRRKLTEEYSLVWLLSAAVLLAVALRGEILQAAARWLHIDSPRVVLLSLALVILAAIAMSLSIVVSRQRRQIDRLMEDTAILSAELRELRAGSEPSEGVVANAPRHRLEARR